MSSPLTHTKLSELIIKFLKSIDSYNSTDTTLSDPTTDQDTMGERARICINQALHLIYSLIKDSRYLENYPTTVIPSISGQEYIDLASESYLDHVESVTEQDNQDRKLEQKSWYWYRRNYPNPEQFTGDPLFYIRRGDRLYLAPTPQSSRNYTIEFKKLTVDLKLPGDLPLIPTQYDYWIIAEATVIWYTMEDPTSVPALVIAERESKRSAALGSIDVSFDRIIQAGSNTESDEPEMREYRRPVG